MQTANAAGHRDLPVPPSFLFGIELERHDPFEWLAGVGVDLRRVLHGEQSFTYHSQAVAGIYAGANEVMKELIARSL